MKVEEAPPCASPSPSPSPPLLRDISNFRTPRRPSVNPYPQSPAPIFFTASKQTPRPSSSFRRGHRPPSSSVKSKAVARKLKAFELEQSQSSRKAQLKKEQSLKSLGKSLTVWLNFLFDNPKLCGCDEGAKNEFALGFNRGKRENGSDVGVGVAVERVWRDPKRQRDVSWPGGVVNVNSVNVGSSLCSGYPALRNSLNEVCSFDDLTQRMREYLSLESCKEIFGVMTQVAKIIDEGRLKMKVHCPIVTDFGMKEKAIKMLMCYSPVWLRIGLFIIFGGDSLVSNEDTNPDHEIILLKMILEKQFFSHMDLAKAYAYNKKVEGLYRPGYYEALGNIILKRLLLLVLVLDRTKSQSSLPLKYGIDGVDGGSPLLFTVQSSIKSSCQMINDFLSSDVMHGEGNLLAHLAMIGYKVSYEQCSLLEYDFRVADLYQDLRNGVRLCRAIQLLQHDSSILTKINVPTDAYKKNLANCGIALHYLRQAGVPLHDSDGMTIDGEDVANGDMELTLSLLWNIFIHLQVPLLIQRTTLLEEISRICGDTEDKSKTKGSSLLELLLHWIQAICETYDFKIENFSSLSDGRAIWCILDYYFRKELRCCASKDFIAAKGAESIMSPSEYNDAVHNFILSQKLTGILGNFPEVLQLSDILEHKGASNDRSVIILLVFLASQLITKKKLDLLNFHKLLGCSCQSLDRRYSSTERWSLSSETLPNQQEMSRHSDEESIRKFKAIQAWWQKMADQHNKFASKPAALHRASSSKYMATKRDNAARIIQSNFRQLVIRRKYLKLATAASFLQAVVRAWLAVRQKATDNKSNRIRFEELDKLPDTFGRYVMLFTDRHDFVKIKASTLLIQQATRKWINRKHHGLELCQCASDLSNKEEASVICEEGNAYVLQMRAVAIIQIAWKRFVFRRSLQNQQSAATKIQSHLRGWLLRKKFLNQKQAALKIQGAFRHLRYYKTRSAIVIQSFVRGWIARRRACRHKHLIVVIQKCYRGWSIRRNFMAQLEAVIKIQSTVRCLVYWKAFNFYRQVAVDIQRFVRGQITRRRLLGASFHGTVSFNSQASGNNLRIFELEVLLHSVLKLQRWWKGVLLKRLREKAATTIQSHIRGWICRQEAAREMHHINGLPNSESKALPCSVLKLQRWWKAVLLHRRRRKAAITIQSHIRGWICRKRAARERHHIVMIQSHWKGYAVRKCSRGQLQELRLRMQRTAANVDDRKRIINRLLAAVAELLSMKSVSGILHTCATLDMATKHSQKCCEELVAAGAVDTLLKLIQSVSRSIPDQEVLKHSLSTLRNLARYQHLVEVLVHTQGSVETILWEFLRNKEEGYYVAGELLKGIFSRSKEIKAIKISPSYIKRLQSLVEELKRKSKIEKRNGRGPAGGREITERRLREAIEIVGLTASV